MLRTRMNFKKSRNLKKNSKLRKKNRKNIKRKNKKEKKNFYIYKKITKISTNKSIKLNKGSHKSKRNTLPT
jgi:hypothetical protein